MQVDVVTPAEMENADRSHWQDLQAAQAGLSSPFLSPSFVEVVGRTRADVRIAIISDGGAKGYFPFETNRNGHARALGMGLSDMQGIVAPDALAIDAVDLLHACGLRSFTFDHLVAEQRAWVATGPATFARDTSKVMDLRAGFDAYAVDRQANSKKLLQATARQMRKLAREHGPVRFVSHSSDHVALDRLLLWKSRQYIRTGRRDVFANPKTRTFVHDLLEVRDRAFTAPLSVLMAGDSMVAAHFGLRSHRTLAWWFPAYDPAFAVYSPGLMLCLEAARGLAGEGLSTLDLGKGDEPYKDRLCNAHIDVLTGSVATTRRTHTAMVLRRWPYEQAMATVLGSPKLRSATRATLARVGAVRQKRFALRNETSSRERICVH
ncbi:GNAT family N-acetyltransferase [soil metagenome]